MIGDNITGNLPDQFRYSPTNTSGIRDAQQRDGHLSRLQHQRRRTDHAGQGVVVSFSYATRRRRSASRTSSVRSQVTLFDTKLWNPSGKATYQMSKNNKLIGYYQWGQKIQPNRLPSSTNSYTDLGSTLNADFGQLDLQGRVERHDQQQRVRRSALRRVRLLLPAARQHRQQRVPDRQRAAGAVFQRGSEGADRPAAAAGDRIDDVLQGRLLGGSHNFKFGGELLMETGWFGYQQAYGGNVRANIGTNGQANTVFMAAPTATQVGSLGDGPNGNLLSISKLNTIDAFVTDQYTVGRATFNLGVRWDHYDVFTPEQRQLA